MLYGVTQLGPILTAMVTPFDGDLKVDDEAVVRLVNHLLDNGSDGIVVAGSTGEAPTLTDGEQIALIKLVVETVGDRGSVVAGTGSNDTRHACYLTGAATELGVDATLSVTPYYNRPNEDGIIRHFQEVAKATNKPVLLYNIPVRTGTNMAPDLLRRLAQIEHIDGVKQANNDELQMIDGLDLYAGNDDVLARTLDLGGAGGILVSSHIVGPAMRGMVDRPEQRSAIHAELKDVFETLFITSNPIPVKAALNMIGIDVGGLRLPLIEATAEQRSLIRAMLERHNLLSLATN